MRNRPLGDVQLPPEVLSEGQQRLPCPVFVIQAPETSLPEEPVVPPLDEAAVDHFAELLNAGRGGCDAVNDGSEYGGIGNVSGAASDQRPH